MTRAFVLLGLFLAVAAASPAGAEPSFVIVKDVKIGSFSLMHDATVRSAVTKFGPPASRRHFGYDQCILDWPGLGLTMRTFFIGGPDVGIDPCGPLGRHDQTTITNQRWRTSAGLRVGDSVAKLRRLYPRAKRGVEPGSWILIVRFWAGSPLPSLIATVKNGQVATLVIRGPRSL